MRDFLESRTRMFVTVVEVLRLSAVIALLLTTTSFKS